MYGYVVYVSVCAHVPQNWKLQNVDSYIAIKLQTYRHCNRQMTVVVFFAAAPKYPQRLISRLYIYKFVHMYVTY